MGDNAAAVLLCGQNSEGQAGIASGQEQIYEFCPLINSDGDEVIEATKITRIVSNRRQSIILTNDGSIFTAGGNDDRELGRPGKRSLFMRLEALESFRVTDAACGEGFFILILSDGKQISWGRNEMGQLGLGHRDSREKPKPASILSTHPGELGFVQIAAGAQHCIALSKRGNVFTWGGNRRGQLGDGFLNSCNVPQLVPQLKHKPIVSVCCGENFCLAMTVGGDVYSWGENTHGQLGQGDTTMRLRPEIIRSLKLAKVCSISAGKAHSLVVSPSGLLFAFGNNYSGQLGLGTDAEKVVSTPLPVEKLRGLSVIEASCGDTHSLILAQEREGSGTSLYVCGQASVGQLGLGSSRTSPVMTPTMLELPQVESVAGKRVAHVSCGGPTSLLSFIATYGVPFQRVPLPSIDLPLLRRATSKLLEEKMAIKKAEELDSGNVKQLSSKYLQRVNSTREMVAAAFSSIPVLNASFRLPHASTGGYESFALCIDLESVRQAYTSLVDVEESQLLVTLGRATMQMTELLREVPTDTAENLSVFLIAFENPLLLNPVQNHVALERLVSGILALQKTARAQLFGWFKHYPSEYFSRVLSVLQSYLSFALGQHHTNADPTAVIMVLEILYNVNVEKRIVPDHYFHNTTLAKTRDLTKERNNQRQAKQQGLTSLVNLLDFPFLYSPAVKSQLMRLDFQEKKQAIQVDLFMFLGQNGYLLSRDGANAMYVPRETHPLPPGLRISRNDGTANIGGCDDPVGPNSLVLSVRVERDDLLDQFLTTLGTVISADPRVLALPLVAEFEGEEGVDAGGVSKEMLTLVIKALVSRTGITSPTNDGKLVWFTRSSPTLNRLRTPAVSPGGGGASSEHSSVMSNIQSQIDAVYGQHGLLAGIDENMSGPSKQPRAAVTMPPSPPLQPTRSSEWTRGLSAAFSFDPATASLCSTYDFEFTLGFLYGFASYNNCLIGLPLPSSLYKIMAFQGSQGGSRGPLMDSTEAGRKLRDMLTLEDLTEVEPSLAAGLRALLEWEDNNIGEVFGITFTASANPLIADRRVFGSEEVVELRDGGQDLVVDKSNREDYVRRLVQHALYDSVSGAACAFLCGLTVLFNCTTISEMCSPQDLEELLCGSPEVGDLSLLRLHTSYRGLFHDEHPLINWFWEILADYSTSKQRRFLTFVTGSDRVPVGGIENTKLVIQSTAADTTALPAAHTCFNILDLPLYGAKETLEAKLDMALNHAEGFGLA